MERIRLFVGKIRIARIAEIARNHRNLRNRLQYALIASVCHLDRSATEILPLQAIFGAEWRDPEQASSAMQLQGVLPTLPVATRLGPSDSGDYARLRCDSGDPGHPPSTSLANSRNDEPPTAT